MAYSLAIACGAVIHLLFFVLGNAQAATQSKELYFSLNNPLKVQTKTRFESEHRPTYKRQYWISQSDVSHVTDVFVQHPDGSVQNMELESVKDGAFVRLNMKRGDGPHHGTHHTYLVDERVTNDTLLIQTAKWATVHHSCAWGHEHKYTPKRLYPGPLERAPLEIIGVDLWDGNFHIRTRSGQVLQFSVFSYGKPVSNAKVTITSDKGWQRQLVTDDSGSVAFQMIRDYYPESWNRFRKSKNSTLFLKATVEKDKQGTLDGIPYSKVWLTTTLSWRYAPAHQDYASYQAGLAIGGVAFLATFGGLFFYRNSRRKPYQEWAFDEKA